MKFGLIVSTLYTDECREIEKFLPQIKEMGFDGAEIAVCSDELDYVGMSKKLKELSLCCTAGAGLTPDATIYSEDPVIVRKGLIQLKRFIDRSHILGSEILGGVIYSAWNDCHIRKDRRLCAENARAALAEAAAYAEEKNVRLCLEVINRYETDALNTLEQGRAIVDSVGSDVLKLHFDTYHANIEEKDVIGEILRSKGYIGHVHYSENDRSAPGHGHIDFKAVTKALRDIGYDDWIVFECFPIEIDGMCESCYTWRQIDDGGYNTSVFALEYTKKIYDEVYGNE